MMNYLDDHDYTASWLEISDFYDESLSLFLVDDELRDFDLEIPSEDRSVCPLVEDTCSSSDHQQQLSSDDASRRTGKDLAGKISKYKQKHMNKAVSLKIEAEKDLKKRKFNPDSELIAAAVDQTLTSLEVDPNSKEGKKKRRQIRNRLSAQFHRDRKNEHIRQLEEQLSLKDREIAALKNQINILVVENNALISCNDRSFLSGIPVSQKFIPSIDYSKAESIVLSNFSSEYCSSSDRDDTTLDAKSSHSYASAGGNEGSSAASVSGSSISPSDSPEHSLTEGHSMMMHMYDDMQIEHAVPTASGRAHTMKSASAKGFPSGLARPLSVISMLCMVSVMLFNQSVTDVSLSSGPSSSPQQSHYHSFEPFYLDLNKPGHAMNERNVSESIASYLTNVDLWTAIDNDKALLQPQAANQEVHEEMPTVERRLVAIQRTDTFDASAEYDSESLGVVTRDPPLTHQRSPQLLSLPCSETATFNASFTTKLPKHHRNLRTADYASAGQNTTTSMHPTDKSLALASNLYSAGKVVQRLSTDSQYHWPASSSFDYKPVHSYSEVMLTHGKALFDPSLALNNKLVPWLSTDYRSEARKEMMQSQESQATDFDNLYAPMQATDLKSMFDERFTNDYSTPSEDKALVQASEDRPFPAQLLLPAVMSNGHFGKAPEKSRDGGIRPQPAASHEHSVLNFITLQLPASSIRVGKSWSNSKDGTIQSIMEVLNITADSVRTVGDQSNRSTPSSNTPFMKSLPADASVEISCIIIGAKLIMREAPQI
jgi:hypothetical protein